MSADGVFLMWGGRDGRVSGSSSSDFTYYADGAILSDVGWSAVPALPLTGSTDPQVVAFDGGFVIVEGDPAPGTGLGSGPRAVVLRWDLSWFEVPMPFALGAVAGGDDVVHFGPDGVHRLEDDEWVPIAADAVPGEMSDGAGALAAASDGSRLWYLKADGLAVVGEIPNAPVDAVVVVGPDIAAWNATDASLALWRVEEAEWEQSDAPDGMRARLGASICATAERLVVWGGWNDRGVLVATDTGVTIAP